VRHLEAAAVAAVFALASAYLASLTAHQAAPVHHTSAQRALAWALLSARSVDELVELTRRALGEHLAALYVDGRPVVECRGAAPAAVCYAAVFFEGGAPHVVRVCASP